MTTTTAGVGIGHIHLVFGTRSTDDHTSDEPQPLPLHLGLKLHFGARIGPHYRRNRAARAQFGPPPRSICDGSDQTTLLHRVTAVEVLVVVRAVKPGRSAHWVSGALHPSDVLARARVHTNHVALLNEHGHLNRQTRLHCHLLRRAGRRVASDRHLCVNHQHVHIRR